MAEVEKIIGIVSGAGPFAGLDLLGKILDQTEASSDQDHLTIISLSRPSHIPDRSEYLLGRSRSNPAHAIAEQLMQLEQMGARVAGIPCNTAHAPPVFDVVLQGLREAGSQLKLINMIEEVAQFLADYYPRIERVGVLATAGTYGTRLYQILLEPAGLEVVIPGKKHQQAIHRAIYDSAFGIKALGIASSQAVANLWAGARNMQERGAEAVILGCTEIPVAVKERTMGEMVVIDPTFILARALIREANTAKLKPLPH
jgi:aspartate racemase